MQGESVLNSVFMGTVCMDMPTNYWATIKDMAWITAGVANRGLGFSLSKYMHIAALDAHYCL
jgi:hypothetical protein